MESLNHDVASVGRWKREHAALERRLEATRAFRGLTASAAPVGRAADLRRGERLFLSIDRAALVEPGSLAVDAAPALDRGVVTITDRRVLFKGPKRTREWAFGKLVEHRHYDRRPATMLEVSNRVRVSGIAYEGSNPADVRFLFDLALAHHDGTVDALESGIARQILRHDAQRPSVHAGAWVWRGWARPVPVASAILTAIVIAGAVLAGSPAEQQPTTALEARGATGGFAAGDFSHGLGDGSVRDPVAAPAPIASVVAASSGAQRATTAPAAAPASRACTSIAVIGPLAIPDPLCTPAS